MAARAPELAGQERPRVRARRRASVRAAVIAAAAAMIAAAAAGCGASARGGGADPARQVAAGSGPGDAAVGAREDGGDEPPVRTVVTSSAIEKVDPVYFDGRTTTLLPGSARGLDLVASTLAGHSDIRLVEIRAHTDRSESAAEDLALTQRQAEIVMAELVSRGIAPERLTAVGRGGEEPLDSADDERARARNRRIELFILRRGDD